jgi:hypothetical protein
MCHPCALKFDLFFSSKNSVFLPHYFTLHKATAVHHATRTFALAALLQATESGYVLPDTSDQMPDFIGGLKGLQLYLSTNTVYPEMESNNAKGA